jgi:methylenetetrahydrofolate--tRNA-(uracil-5-)-methyltransferase
LFAGQLTGVEGYTESAASGLMAGINLARILTGGEPVLPPPTTMLGALYRYLRDADPAHFEPMNANFGLLEPLEIQLKDKTKRKEALAARALADIDAFASEIAISSPLSALAERGSGGEAASGSGGEAARGSGGEV